MNMTAQFSGRWVCKGILLALVLFAFISRIYHLDYQPLWRDEVDAIRFSGDAFLSLAPFQNLFGVLTQQGHNGPLYFVFLRGWRSLSGDSEFALRYFSLVAGVLMVPLTYRLARRLKLGYPAAAIAALLVTTSPYLLWYSQEAKMYTWLACLILTAIYAYQAALVAPKASPWWVLFVFATSLSFYTHILAPLMLVVYLVWGLMQWSRFKARWVAWSASMSALSLPYLPLLWWQAPLFLERFYSGHPFYPFQKQMSLLLHLYSIGILRFRFSFWAIMLTVFLVLVGLLGIGRLGNTAPVSAASQRLQLGVWFLIPSVLVYLVSLRVTVFEDRYLIYLSPAYYLLLALGLSAIAARGRWLAGGLLAVMVGFNLWGGWQQATRTIKADFRSAAQYVADTVSNEASCGLSATPTVMFQMPYLQHTFAYYSNTPFRPLEGIWTNDNRDPGAVAQDMAQLTQGIRTLWFVVSEEDHWDERHLIRQWLDEQATVTDQTHFVNVDVYRYLFGAKVAAGGAASTQPAPEDKAQRPYKIFLPLVLCGPG